MINKCQLNMQRLVAYHEDDFQNMVISRANESKIVLSIGDSSASDAAGSGNVDTSDTVIIRE